MENITEIIKRNVKLETVEENIKYSLYGENFKNLEIEGNGVIDGKARFSSLENFSILAPSKNTYTDHDDFEKVIIKDGIIGIGNSVFENCKLLRIVAIPNSVTYIDSTAFAGCDNLSEIIPSSVQFNSEMIKILCENNMEFTKILFRELFTNIVFFSDDAIHTLLSYVENYYDDEFRKIAFDSIEYLSKACNILLLIRNILQNENYDYLDDVIDEIDKKMYDNVLVMKRILN